jgi:hypothetical protein
MAVKLSQHKTTEEQWCAFDTRFQLHAIATELARISSASVRHGNEDRMTHGAYDRFFDLVDLTLADPKWKGQVRALYGLRDAVASLYVGAGDPAVVAHGFSEVLLLIHE